MGSEGINEIAYGSYVLKRSTGSRFCSAPYNVFDVGVDGAQADSAEELLQYFVVVVEYINVSAGCGCSVSGFHKDDSLRFAVFAVNGYNHEDMTASVKNVTGLDITNEVGTVCYLGKVTGLTGEFIGSYPRGTSEIRCVSAAVGAVAGALAAASCVEITVDIGCICRQITYRISLPDISSRLLVRRPVVFLI